MMRETGVSQDLYICTKTILTRRAEFNRTCCSVSSAGEGVGCSIVNTFCIYMIAPEARFCSTANSWHLGFPNFHTSAVLIGWLSEDDWEEVKQVEDGNFHSFFLLSPLDQFESAKYASGRRLTNVGISGHHADFASRLRQQTNLLHPLLYKVIV